MPGGERCPKQAGNHVTTFAIELNEDRLVVWIKKAKPWILQST